MQAHRHYVRNPHRRGMATLETVLVLPILLSLALMIFVIATAGVRKASTSVAARHSAWAQRSQHTKPPLRLTQLIEGTSRQTATEQIQLPSGLAGSGGTQVATSVHEVLIGAWDDPEAGFGAGTRTFIPHAKPLQAVLTGGTFTDPFNVGPMLANAGGQLLKFDEAFSSGDGPQGNALFKELINDAIADSSGSLGPLVEEMARALIDNTGLLDAVGDPFEDLLSELKLGSNMQLNSDSSVAALTNLAKVLNVPVLIVRELLATILQPMQTVSSFLNGLLDVVPDDGLLDDIGLGALKDLANDIVDGIVDIAGDALAEAAGALFGDDTKRRIKGLKDAVGAIKDVLSALETIANRSANVGGGLLDALNGDVKNIGTFNSDASLEAMKKAEKAFNDLAKGLEAVFG